MARYGAAFSVAGTNTANTFVVNLTNTGTAVRMKVVQLAVGIAVAPTTAPSFYLSRATARGTNTTTLAGQAFDPSDPASAGTLDLTNSVAPTFSTTLKLLVVDFLLLLVVGGFGILEIHLSLFRQRQHQVYLLSMQAHLEQRQEHSRDTQSGKNN